MATYLIVVKTLDGSDIPHMDPDELAVEVAELLYHEPAHVTGRRLDRASIAAVLRQAADDPHEVDNLADAVVAYLEAQLALPSDWVALTPDQNTLPPMTPEA